MHWVGTFLWIGVDYSITIRVFVALLFQSRIGGTMASLNFYIVLGLSVIFSTPLAWGLARPAPTLDPVKWGELKGIKSIGANFAVGVNQKHEALALYDLSYYDPNSRIELGCLDFDCANFDQIISLIKGAQSGSLDSKTLEASSVAMAGLTALRDDLQKKSKSEVKTPFPKNWWKNIIWNKDFGPDQPDQKDERGPERFSLADIKFESVAKDYADFKKTLDGVGGIGILNGFEFERTPNGGYRIYWVPQRLSISTAANLGGLPLKIADLRCPQCGLASRLTRESAEQILYGLIGQIPIPMVGALLNVALGQWIHFRNELLRIHQEELLEALNAAEDGPQDMRFNLAPMVDLDPKAREAVAESVYYSQSGLLSFWQWITKTPAQYWQEEKDSDRVRAKILEKELIASGLKLSLLNPRYAVARDGAQQTWIYPLASPRYWNLVKPFIAIDYQRPNKIMIERISIESASVLIQFATSFIPVPAVGTAINLLFEGIVHSQMHNVQHYEARLNAHLMIRQSLGEDWRCEMRSRRLQTANHMGSAWDQRMVCIKPRKEALGIQ